MESRGPDGFWAASSAPNTEDRHLLERPVGKEVGESGSAAVSCRRDLRDGGSLHSEEATADPGILLRAASPSPCGISSLSDVTNTGLSH